jgi:hypothetical protein
VLGVWIDVTPTQPASRALEAAIGDPQIELVGLEPTAVARDDCCLISEPLDAPPQHALAGSTALFVRRIGATERRDGAHGDCYNQ